MKIFPRFRHPLWTHAAGAALYAFMLYRLAVARLPERIPMHFDLSGRPNRWGSPTEFALLVLILPLFFLAFGLVIDELWAGEERDRKRFNFFAPFDEFFIGLFAAFFLSYVRNPQAVEKAGLAAEPLLMAALAGGAAAAAVLLELMRPFRPSPPEPHTSAADAAETRERILSAARPLFWQAQDPAWMRMLAPGLSLLLLAASASILLSGDSAAVFIGLPLCLAGAAFMLVCWGGIRVIVNEDAVEVRLGYVGARLLRLGLGEIASVSVVDFSPLRDFGGWGIRYGRKKTWGYFLRGRRGVLLVSAAGKRYLLGSDDPERLAAAIEAMMERARSRVSPV